MRVQALKIIVHELLVLHFQIPPKLQKLTGEQGRKNKRENPQKTPRSRSSKFPSLRKNNLIGGAVDLDLLSLFP
jgi:hypothetical protein